MTKDQEIEILKAQLAEGVGFLDRLSAANTYQQMLSVMPDVEAFLARHAIWRADRVENHDQ